MNWGKGLVIGLASFMIFITVLVVLMFRTAEDNFDKDYYERGLTFDIDYNQMQQVITDKVEPVVKQTNDLVTINFAVADSGSVNFKRPSDSRKDQAFTFNQKDLAFPKSGFEKGEYSIEIRWTAGDKKYLYKTNMFMR